MRWFGGLGLVFALLVSAARADVPTDLNAWLLYARESGLAHHRGWLKLLHYEADSWNASGWRSSIISPEFFLHPEGNVQPQKELEATLRAFYSPPAKKPDQHPLCRFRARYLWLKRNAPNGYTLPEMSCPAYNAWVRSERIKSVSVIYATGYLGNPASFYGHILLKFNTGSVAGRSHLLDTSVNFGAIVPSNEDPITYIVKGLVGGYDAGFSHIKYYFHTHNYGEVELRDLWEYQLDLRSEDIDLLVAHTWELLGKRYIYYFFNKNCAFRMGELLEVIPGVEAIPENKYWVLPQALIQRISRAKYHGKPLVHAVRYIPSRQSRLYERFRTLTPEQHQWVTEIIGDRGLLDGPAFRQLSRESKFRVLDTLLDYYQYIRKAKKKSADPANVAYQRVLRERYTLPAGSSVVPERHPPEPDASRDPSLFQAGVAHNSANGQGITLALRPAYYDRLDAEAGHIPFSELTMAGAEVAYFHDQLKIRKLDIVAIESVSTRGTGLPGDSNYSWKLRLGADSQNLACEHNCFVSTFQGDAGYTWPLSERYVAGGFLGAALQDNRNGYGNVYGRASAFLVFKPVANTTVSLNAERRYFPDRQQQKNENKFDLTVRYRIARDWDIRFRYAKHVAEEASITVGRYW